MNEKVLLSADKAYFLNSNISLSQGCAVAVGSFDGVHLGHQALLKTLTDEAERLSLPSIVFTFDPEDNPKSAPLLATPAQKLELLRSFGVDAVFSVPFSALRAVSAEDFTLEYLFRTLGAKSIVCGYDFRFGKDRAGNVDVIRSLLSPNGVSVVTPDVFLLNGSPVSSTAVRELIARGNVSQAAKLLGRRFSFTSKIIQGAQLGRTLGFPTINQHYPEQLVCLLYGVYAVNVSLNGKNYGGVANFGVKPTVGGETLVCETHIFGYSGDCYGETAEISFVEFLRNEQRFPSLSELKQQVDADKNTALDILKKEKLL